ncbi:lasso peptide biosynthesis B2 protein [Deinococcus sp.]|uniref:lasso peptide biosynthesis B2 protein n=1 Tax=Deinococcus sp. TaxID=47478 RepID=UPI0025C0DBCC|nr:lasso peptide biosynthesis B2 protein [Deinococcus sp.]
MPTQDRSQTLVRVLTSPGTLQPTDLSAVLGAGLGGAVRAQLPEDHLLRGPLRQQALDLSLRHAHIRAELRPLLAAWAAEGIEALLFKGFALAEFEYATPGERFYGDVDLLLPEDLATVMRAAHIALAHGWRSDGQHADPELWTHETMHLYSPDRNVRLDVHRWVIAENTGAGAARLRALTHGFRARARRCDWQGLPVWLPDPRDAAVLNIALARSWGGDTGGVKPADYLDLHLLACNHALSADTLRQHAEQLGGAATWAAFTQICDPARQRLVLDIQQTRPIIHAALAADGLNARRGLWQSRALVLRRVIHHLPGALLDVAAAWWALRRSGDPRRPLARWTPLAPPHRLDARSVDDRVVAVSWWTRLFYPRQRRLGVCVPRAYATYRSLRRAGHPAVFVSGVTRAGGGITGHAWVEDDQGNLEKYNEPENRQRFKAVFTFPPSA